MKTKSYNIELTNEEIIALHKVLGRFTDIEFEKIGITSGERESLRNMYNELAFIYDKNGGE